MQILPTEKMRADALNTNIMRMAQNTAIHQWPQKLTDEIIQQDLNTPTLAVATASLQSNSQVNYRQTEHLRSLMKIMLDSQMLNDQLDAQQTLAKANDKQSKASNFLGVVNIFLAITAVGLAAVQVFTAH
jgi:hypothetical protein